MKKIAFKLFVIYTITVLVVLYTANIQSFVFEIIFAGNIDSTNASTAIYQHHILTELGMAIMSSIIALSAAMLTAGIAFTALFEDSDEFIFMWGIFIAASASIVSPAVFSDGISLLTSMILSAIITAVFFITYSKVGNRDHRSKITPTIIMPGSK